MVAYKQLIYPNLDDDPKHPLYVYVYDEKKKKTVLCTNWVGWCLAVCKAAFGATKSLHSALNAWNANTTKHTNYDLPEGVYCLIWWDGYWYDGEYLGHVAIAKRTGDKIKIWSSPYKKSYTFAIFEGSIKDTTHIRLSAEHTAESTKTFYFRIFAFLPPDYTGDYNNTLGDTTHFTLNSEFNYPKLFQSGTISVPDNSTKNVAHNLGYVPQARAWWQRQTSPFDDYSIDWNILAPTSNAQYPGGLLGVTADTTNVKFGACNQYGDSITYKYMIFGDEV